MGTLTGGRKFDAGKARMGLLPWRALNRMAEYVADCGTGKEGGYEQGLLAAYVAKRSGGGIEASAALAYNAMMIVAEKVGLDVDPDGSGLEWGALEEVAQVATYGADLHASNNWQTLESAVARYEDALLRHYKAERTGEYHDKDSGRLHAAHMACDAFFLLALDVGHDEQRDESYFEKKKGGTEPIPLVGGDIKAILREQIRAVEQTIQDNQDALAALRFALEGEDVETRDTVPSLPDPLIVTANVKEDAAVTVRPKRTLEEAPKGPRWIFSPDLDEGDAALSDRFLEPSDLIPYNDEGAFYACHTHAKGFDSRRFSTLEDATSWAEARRLFAHKSDVIQVKDDRGVTRTLTPVPPSPPVEFV